MRILLIAVVQSVLLCSGQVLLKFALQRMGAFSWTLEFLTRNLTNTLLWFYIIKNFPFSMAYPMISLSYVFGMFAAIVFFHEQIPLTRWIGVFLIMTGCVLIAK